MHKFIMLLAIAQLACSAAKAADDQDTEKGMKAVAEAIGLKQTNEVKGASCKIFIDANQDEAIKSIAVLQKFGVLNDEMSKRELEQAPTKTTMAIALQFAPVAIKSVYSEFSDIDKCIFVHNIISDDEYGNSRKELMFSCYFDRTIYKKINWDNFKTQSIPKVSKNFVFNPAISRRISAE